MAANGHTISLIAGCVGTDGVRSIGSLWSDRETQRISARTLLGLASGLGGQRAASSYWRQSYVKKHSVTRGPRSQMRSVRAEG
jgi:hypothetical protein